MGRIICVLTIVHFNKNAIKNKLLLPWIEDIFDRLQGSSYYKSIDLKSGYYYIHLVLEDIHKPAFWTQFGLKKYVVMSIGLTNASRTFNRLIEQIFTKQ